MEADHGLHTVENMAARSAFMRLVTTRPDATSLLHALVRGPLGIYGTFGATLYAPDDAGQALELQGQWGFGPSLATYSSLPLRLSFPLTRSYLTVQPIFSRAVEVDARYPLMTAARDGILSEQAGVAPDDVTIVAMPLQYQGVAIGACSWWCTHRGPWTWNDYSYIDGTAAILSVWLQLHNYEHSLAAAGIASTGMPTRTRILTERQRAVLLLIRDGKSNAAIASALGYSVSTVKNDVQALFTVLGCTRRKELARKAEAAGLFTEATDEVA